MQTAAVLWDTLARALPPPPHRPVAVAFDGGDGAGKTTLAALFAAHLRAAGRPVVHTSLDWFHYPQEHRHRVGRTGQTVWSRHFDYRAVRRELLAPWLAGPGSPYRARWHDVTTDRYLEETPEPVPADGVLVVDGVFAQRDELRDLWDLAVYVDADDEVRVARMARRDGGSDDPARPAQVRYLEAQRIYRDCCAPRDRADFVIDNNEVARLIEVGAPGPTEAGSKTSWRPVPGGIARTIRLSGDSDRLAALAARIDRLAAQAELPADPLQEK